MTAAFTAQEVDLECKENRDIITAYQKLDPEGAVYKNLNISQLEGVFTNVDKIESKVTNLQGRLVSFVGDPGVGKTTAAQYLAWLWALGKYPSKEKYKLVFFIPIRQVKEGSLASVLSDLQLTPHDFSDGFVELSQVAKDTLFILDGVDENDITKDL